jgi:hypothetical protein
MFPHAPELDDALRLATVLAEIGETFDAEALAVEVLERRPDDLTALDLFAKIKHMRGELSVAVACWARVHSHSPQNEAALMHLSSMLQLARDPERGAGEFLALGPFQLWRKPAAHLELEEAFRLFLSRRPDEAKAKCERLAARFRGKERDLYKLAVLARAWIAELSGDLPEACEVLEGLGLERGYETDTDRIIALARVYERIGTTEALEKAVHVCEYLRRNIDRFSILGRLGSLYEALGKERKARECRVLFLSGFRQRMHRPCLGDVASAAARHYLPLSKLRKIPLHGPGPAEEAPRRERAVALALAGDRPGARGLLSPPEGPLDLRYLADLAAAEGEEPEAVRLYLESLAGGEDDPRVLVWLLVEASDEGREAAAVFFRSRPAEAERARASLERRLRGASLRPSLWEALAALHAVAGDAARREACSSRAAVLREAAGRRKRAVGRALAAAVYHFVGKSKGIVHEVWASRRPVPPGKGGQLDEILGNLTSEMERSARNTFLSVREYALSKFPHRTTDLADYNYSYKVTKEDEPSGGLSAGVPTALAFLSVFLDRPLPQDVASSGALVADAHDVLVVKGIGEPEHKVRGAYNRNLRMLVLPEANRAELIHSPLVPAEVVEEVVRFASDFDRVAALVFGEEIWSP